MKKIIFVPLFLIVFFILALHAQAYTSYTNNSLTKYASGGLRSTTSQVSSGFCLNYGHYHKNSTDFQPGSFLFSDIALFKTAGVTCLRLAVDNDGFATSSVDIQLATTTVNAGFFVLNGMTLGACCVSSSTVGQYMLDTVNVLTPIYIQYNFPAMVIGNEEEYHIDNSSISTTTFQNDMKVLAAQVKAAGYTGKVYYITEIGQEATWKGLGLGSLDGIGFNVYGNSAFMTAKAGLIVSDFGSNGFIGEWNFDGSATTGGLPDFGGNDSKYAMELQSEATALRNSGVSKYYMFTYRTNNVYQGGIFNGMSLVTDAGPKALELQSIGL